VQLCPNCGEDNPERFRVCGFCGTQLTPEGLEQDVRKTVSVVFCDIKDSTELGEKLDSESLREVLNVYFTAMRAPLERHGGVVEKYIGDAIMAVFGLPRQHEDDALRAVRAAAEMGGALDRVNVQLEAIWGIRLENRTGVNTGEVVAGDLAAGQRLVTGDTVNTAARLEQAAPAGGVLIGGSTYRLIRHAVEVVPVEPLRLKGKAERVTAYRLVRVVGDEAYERRFDSPLVGRQAELEVLETSLLEARSDARCRIVTAFGPAGVGKSRLLAEFLRRCEDRAITLKGRCLPYGSGITYFAIAETIREAAGIAEVDGLGLARSKLSALLGDEGGPVAERLEGAIGLTDATFAVTEIIWAVRRFLEILSARRPVVVLIDDIHWAEPTLLELLQQVTETTSGAVLLLCSSRPDLLEEHAEWGENGPRVRAITLEPLSEGESERVIEHLLGDIAVDHRVAARIVGTSGGNPLFVEQMLSMLIDDEVLALEGGRWKPTEPVETIEMPPTISALLSSRLDRLGVADRATIERAAVIGQVFYPSAVEVLLPEPLRAHLPASLDSLATKELIRPHRDVVLGYQTYRFLHILIRDAAYSGLLKRTRAELHEAFVNWLEAVASDRALEYEEIRGYHLEQAFLIRTELVAIDDHVKLLGRRAAAHLSSAGRRALARGDLPAAANLLQRAAALLPRDDPVALGHMIDVGEALLELGDFSRADDVLSGVVDRADRLGEVGLAYTARLSRLRLHYETEGDGTEGQVTREVTDAISMLEPLEYHEGLIRAWWLLTLVHWTNGRYGEAESAAERMIHHARRAGERVMEARLIPSLVTCSLYGPTPVPEAITRARALLEETGGDRKAEALIACSIAHLEAMRGDFEQARSLYRKSRAIFEEFGWRLQAALTSIDSGPIEMLAGDLDGAVEELRRDHDALDEMGEHNYISTTAAFLAEALYRQGKLDEAEEYTIESEKVAASDDVSSQFLWRSVRARILARRGALEDGEALARTALDIIRTSDEPDSQAEGLLGLAEVLALAGRVAEAAATARDALGLFEAKGNVISEARSRRVLEDLEQRLPR
jgi:class 3 adenylate cyclase/tetratricopeptide (TPR) repeat protein